MRKYIVHGAWLTDDGLELMLSQRTIDTVLQATQDKSPGYRFACLLLVASVTHGDFKKNKHDYEHKPLYKMRLTRNRLRNRYYSNTQTIAEIVERLIESGLLTRSTADNAYTVAPRYRDHTRNTTLLDPDMVARAEYRLKRSLNTARSKYNDKFFFWPGWRTLNQNGFNEYLQRDTLYSVMRDRASENFYNSTCPYQAGGRTTPVYATLTSTQRRELIDLRSARPIASIDLSGAFFACIAKMLDQSVRYSRDEDKAEDMLDFVSAVQSDEGIYAIIQRLCGLDPLEEHKAYVKAWALEWFNRNHNAPVSVLDTPIQGSQTEKLWNSMARRIETSNHEAYRLISRRVRGRWPGVFTYLSGVARSRSGNYVAKYSQSIEARWLDQVASRLRGYPECSFSHVYDCVLVDQDHLEIAKIIVAEELHNAGIICTYSVDTTISYKVTPRQQTTMISTGTDFSENTPLYRKQESALVPTFPRIPHCITANNAYNRATGTDFSPEYPTVPRLLVPTFPRIPHCSLNTRGRTTPLCGGIRKKSVPGVVESIYWYCLTNAIRVEQEEGTRASLMLGTRVHMVAETNWIALVSSVRALVQQHGPWLSFSVTSRVSDILDTTTDSWGFAAFALGVERSDLMSRVVTTARESGKTTYSVQVHRRRAQANGIVLKKQAGSLVDLGDKLAETLAVLVFNGGLVPASDI